MSTGSTDSANAGDNLGTDDPSLVAAWVAETIPELEAASIENRLRHSATEGGYLILTVEPSQLERARAELAARFDLDACDLDDLFLESLRAEAERAGASWDVVLAADAKAHHSTDWANLQRLVERALPGIEGRLRSGPKTCLALHAGLLAIIKQEGKV